MYEVDKNYQNCKVYGKGKPFVLGKADQKTLKNLFERGHPGISFKEAKEEKK